MIVATGSWLAGNWKALSVVAGILGAGATATYNYTDEVDTRLDVIEVQAVRDSAQMDHLVLDVGEIKCMVIQTAQGEDPLDCLE